MVISVTRTQNNTQRSLCQDHVQCLLDSNNLHYCSNQILHTSHLAAKTEQRIEQDLHHIRRVLFPPETKPEDEPMPLDDVNLEDKNVYIPNDSPDWFKEPSPDRHLCIHDEHQDGCEHFRQPPRPDSIVPYGANDSPSGFMSLHDIEDMNILVDVDFSSDDELPDLI